ncbi:MAG TPA: hydrogenase iron-sulfur subunit [Burkholderiales bacterium]|nr:hydrogenase iron-sulfur subunit [Burkholderiales bacterium]
MSPPTVRSLLARAVRRAEAGLDVCFGARANPLRHLGAVGFLLLAAAIVSGIYVYIWFDTSTQGAYRSVTRLSELQWGFAALMRSVHRYASDGFALVMLLHLAREWILGRTHAFRWFSWLSGVPLLWLAFSAGVVGFWLVWDALAQFSLVASLEWLDALKIFGEPLARNVLVPDSLDDRFFSLLVFLHIGLPLLLLLGLWVHLQRIARPDIWPAPILSGCTLATLIVLSLAVPVQSAAPADLSRVAHALALDWFYLAPNVLMYVSSPIALWVLAGGATALLALLPLLSRTPRAAVAQVSADHCNGCERCFVDCPYGAITMQPHPKGRPGMRIAVVDAELCAGCGICAGACPSATPLRRDARLVSGIDMPQLSIATLGARLDEALARLMVKPKIVVFGCQHAARFDRSEEEPAGSDVVDFDRFGRDRLTLDPRRLDRLAAHDTAFVPLLCAGQLPPSFVQYALRRGVDGVVIAACPEGGCEFRLGERWTAERLRGEREPRLRRSVPAHAWRVVHARAGEGERLQREVEALRAALQESAHVG